MKNVIGQLYGSRPRGAKTFERNGILFGWRAIHDVYNEDIERARQGLALQVPGLCLNYVVRDACMDSIECKTLQNYATKANDRSTSTIGR